MRKKIKRKENRFDKLLEIPKEIATSTPRLIINGFEDVLVENYKGVLEYEENFIKIATYIGIVNINGINLKLFSYEKPFKTSSHPPSLFFQ